MEYESMETLILNIKGMTCGGCANSVTGVLQKISGVTRAAVSLQQNNVTITYDPAQANPAQFKAAIEEAGFDVI
jgi:copper chaperone